MSRSRRSKNSRRAPLIGTAPPVTPAPAERVSIAVDGQTIEAELRRSPRARRVRIEVGGDGAVRVVAPARTSATQARAALASRASWVEAKLRQAESRRANPALPAIGPDRIWLHGEPIGVVVAPRGRSRLTGNQLQVPKAVADDPAAIARWYRDYAGVYLRDLVAVEAARLGASVASVGIRDQRTRWGSCSSRGHISLNWRLVLAPAAVARYVVVHELVHLSVPNHSKRFWSELESALPEWRAGSQWLRAHGHELSAYVPLG